MYIFSLFEKNGKMEKITPVEKNVLYYFTLSPRSSIYKIHKSIKEDYEKRNKTIDYKNVYIRAQKLLKNDLIIKDTKPGDEKSSHGAIYYKISPFGIYFLLLNNLHNYNKSIITEHIESPFFKFFLFPYFEVETIKQITDEKVIKLIFNYLNDCALQMANFLNSLKEIKEQGGIFYHKGFVTSIFDKNPDSKNTTVGLSFLEVIRRGFESEQFQSKDKSRIEILEKNKKAKLTDGFNELFLEIFEDNNNDRQKVILTDNKKKSIEYSLVYDSKRKGYSVYRLNSMTVKEYLRKYDFFEKGIFLDERDKEDLPYSIRFNFFYDYPNDGVIKLGYDIIEEIDFWRSVNTGNNGFGFKLEVDYENINLLSNDKRFIKLIEIVKRRFENRYNLFMNKTNR